MKGIRNVVRSIGNKLADSSRTSAPTAAPKSMSRTVRSPFKKLARAIRRG